MRWLRLAIARAGYSADEIDLETAQDLAAELVHTGRIRPYVEWVGGETLAVVRARAEAERALKQAEGMF